MPQRILVVDDSPDACTTMRTVLTAAGHTVRLASNEAEALNAIVEDPFDLAVVDVRLHGDNVEDESGLSLAMAIRHLNKVVRIILATGYPVQSQQVVRAIRLYGAIDFVEKNANIGDAVLTAIHKAEQELKGPCFESSIDATKLYLSLTPGQPLVVRSHGHYVNAVRTWSVLRADAERYARWIELARKDVSAMRFQVAEIGTRLWNDVIAAHSEATAVFIEARARSHTLSLVFESPRELVRLPLEFLRSDSPAEYLVLQHPLSRLLYNAVPRNEALSPTRLASLKKLNILLIASNTTPSIPGVDVEIRSLADFWQSQNAIPAEVTVLPTEEASYARIQEELKKSRYHIVHYSGHGSFNLGSPEESALYFWAGANKEAPIKKMMAVELKMHLEQAQPLFVYFSSCYGAATGGPASLLDDDFLGLADAVAQAGVPSVLAFRWPVSDRRAPDLALSFYQALLKYGSPDIALWSARCELAAADRNEPTWLSPVLVHQE